MPVQQIPEVRIFSHHDNGCAFGGSKDFFVFGIPQAEIA